MGVFSAADLYRSGQSQNPSYADLTGWGRGGKGLIDVYLLKYNIKDHMLNTLTKKHNCAADLCKKMNDVFGGHASYRELLSPLADENGAKAETGKILAWQVGWPQSWLMYAQFVEELLYTTAFDGSLKIAVKNRKIADGGL